jgi:glutathione S-transferase
MSLELFLHPLSSYCHKVLIALYENDIPFKVKRARHHRGRNGGQSVGDG